MAYIRSSGLRGVRQVVTELGGDPHDLARRAGLPPGALDTDEMLVEDLSIARTWTCSARSPSPSVTRAPQPRR